MNRIKRIFVNEWGQLRIGWRLVLGIGVYAAVLYGTIGILSLAFGKLFEAWGVTNANLIYAPRWAQWIVAAHADVVYMVAYAAALLAAIVLARRWTLSRKNIARQAGIALLTGLIPGILLTAAAFALDSMRMERPLLEPTVLLTQISALAVLILGSLSGEALTKRLMFDPLRERFGRFAGYAAVAMMSVLISGRWASPMGIFTATMMSVVSCVFYERGGMVASAALSAGWSAWTGWLFAWPDTGSASVYRIYTVSDSWLTGGNTGAAGGFGSMLLWTIIAAILLRKELRKGISRMNKRRNTNG